MTYWRFFAMIITSTIVMFFLMYINSYSIEQVYFSETRSYMALYMGAAMAIIMLGFMLGMYSSNTVNMMIFGGSALLFAVALFLVRSQATVQDLSWMRAMIPHHSIAILTSERAETSDPRVAGLAAAIVTAQNREISEMRYLIEDIQVNGEAGPEFPTGESTAPAEIQTLAEAISTPVIASIRPDPMTAEEISRGLNDTATCEFTRAVNADPILATSGTDGLAKVSESLIQLTATSAATRTQGSMFEAEGIRMTISPTPGDDTGAKLVFDLSTEPALSVGFDGYWTCN